LLAQLHLSSLIGKRSPKAVRKTLEKLPSGSEAYDHAYRNAMERIKGQVDDQEELALQVLSWITCAKRPLTTRELQIALGVEVGEPDIDEENLPQICDMVSVCAGLVTVDEESGIIRLVHYTTQEYFNRTQNLWFPNASANIATTCVTYLSFDVFESGFCQTDNELEHRLQSHQLYDYAARNWGHHARETSHCPKGVLCFLQRIQNIEASSQVLIAEPELWNMDSCQRAPRRMVGLHLAAYFGIRAATELLLHTSSLDSSDSHGHTPLIYATKNGHEAIVIILLATGQVNVDSKDRWGQTPLSFAAEGGHKAIVTILSATGQVNVDSKDQEGRTPLSYAARGGHKAIVTVLLATGQVDVDSKDRRGRTPLSFAAGGGHEAIVTVLLATGQVDVDLKDQWGRTPLSFAAGGGHKAIVTILQAAGRVNSKN
jgi:hypothetical protein